MKKKVNPFWMALCILLSLAILGLCVFAGRGGTLYLQAEGDPQELVRYFFNSILAGEYGSAYACLSDYSSLGLENVPSSPSGRTLYEALRQSYAYSLPEESRVENLSAVQTVEFRYLDVKAVEQEIAERVEGITERLVADRDSAEIYDEEGRYQASFTDEVYATALAEVLENAEDYYTTATMDLSLSYSDGAWKMKTSPALFQALMGGV